MPTSLRSWIAAATILLALIEWLLFELVRIPYRPPYDMLTLLGQEKYAVLDLMAVVLAVWLAFLILSWFRATFTIRDYLAFAALLAVLSAVLGLVVSYPPRPVTPFDLILQ
jgi:hypothetical protein